MKWVAIFLITIFFVYLFFASQFQFKFSTTSSNYFNYLAEAFLQGKLHLVSRPNNLSDLIFFKNKLFLYWPPVPAIILMPFVAIFGTNFSDILYTSIVGGLNCIIFYFVLNEIRKSRLIKFNRKAQVLTTLFFSFGTVHFYLSLFGRVWFTSQIFSLFFFLLSLLAIFKYYNQKKTSSFYFLFSSLCLSLSFLGRNTFILAIPFYLNLIYFKEKSFFKKTILFSLTPLLIIALSGIYNFLRFGSFLENGYKYHRFNPIFLPAIEKFGFFNLAYFPINFYYNFVNPLKFKLSFPFINPDAQGNSIFLTSPLFFYLFKIKDLFKYKNKHKRLFFVSIIGSCLLMIAPSLLLFGTGWFQFGSRYLLDIIPFLILLILPLLNNFKSKLSIVLLGVSIFINVMAFFWWKSLNIL